jgi:predicted alpha/beta-hydrolase family hydrolase
MQEAKCERLALADASLRAAMRPQHPKLRRDPSTQATSTLATMMLQHSHPHHQSVSSSVPSSLPSSVPPSEPPSDPTSQPPSVPPPAVNEMGVPPIVPTAVPPVVTWPVFRSPSARALFVLVFAPGAAGTTAKATLGLLEQLGREASVVVRRCEPVRWDTRDAGSAHNCQAVLHVAAAAANDYPLRRIVLCGASFGSRVVAEVLRRHHAALPARTARALIICGYPLQAPGEPVDHVQARALHLLALPSGLRVLFVQGECDEYLGPLGLGALRGVMGRMACHTELHVVPRGGHGMPAAADLKRLTAVRQALLTFLAKLP